MDKYFQYVPITGFPAACREFIDGKKHSIVEAESVEEAKLGVFNYLRHGAICVENLAALGGLAYIVFK